MKTPLEKMRDLFDTSRQQRIDYRQNGGEYQIDAAACAIREDAIAQCMIIAGMPRDQAMKLLEYHPGKPLAR